MIDKSFIEKIESMSVPTIFEQHGLPYSSKPLNLVKPPQASSFQVQTLTALADYCERELEDGRNYIVHIADYNKVVLMDRLDPDFRTRETLLVAQAFDYEFPFDEHLKADQFIINLQAMFIQDETTAKIMSLVGNMTTTSEVGTKDDGVTQRVEARTGLAKVENVSVPNPVRLAPFRTFIEIDQPYSNFVLRLDSSHRAALYEADGGAWKVESIKRIKEWLQNALKSAGVGGITVLA